MISPELLRRYPLFAGVAADTLKEIALAGEEMDFSKGEWLFHQNQPADALYLIVTGALEPTVGLNSEDANYTPLPRLIDGDVMGWSALVEPRIYKFGSVAEVHSRVVRLDAARLLALMDDNPAVGYLIMSRLAHIIGERLTNLRIQFVSIMAEGAL